MNDTPRTDAAIVCGEHIAVSVDFARELERENTKLRLELLGGPDKVLRCAFCGHEYPEGTPTHKYEALVAHIRVCEAHPIGIENRRLHEENDRLQRAYVRPDDLRAQIETLHAVCRENVISARIIKAENDQRGYLWAIDRDAKFIIERTEKVLPPR